MNNSFFGGCTALLRWFFCILVTILVLCFLLPFIIFRVRSVLHLCVRYWAHILSRILGLKFEIENKELLTTQKSFILLVNHQSYLDIISLYRALDIPIVWMAKASLFKIPVFGWAMSASGCIPVKRDKAEKARESLFQAALLVRQGRGLVIFPEGTRGNLDGSMIPFKKGAFVLAKKARVVIQPVTLFGPHKVLPVSGNKIIPRFYVKNVIRVVIHKPIESLEYENLNVSQLQSRIYNIIERPIDRLRAFNEILD